MAGLEVLEILFPRLCFKTGTYSTFSCNKWHEYVYFQSLDKLVVNSYHHENFHKAFDVGPDKVYFQTVLRRIGMWLLVGLCDIVWYTVCASLFFPQGRLRVLQRAGWTWASETPSGSLDNRGTAGWHQAENARPCCALPIFWTHKRQHSQDIASRKNDHALI